MPRCKHCITHPFETIRDIMDVSQLVELVDRPNIKGQIKRVLFTRDYHHMHLKYKVLTNDNLRWYHHNKVRKDSDFNVE